MDCTITAVTTRVRLLDLHLTSSMSTKSGEIEKQEVRLLVKMMFGRHAPDEETEKIIRILDKDKDGKLSLTEFLEIQSKSAPS